ncbi:unnamed protein product [Coregonus sp. 'balchen']|nr:unnamed protein product [Coregonus sp. 'balchen']
MCLKREVLLWQEHVQHHLQLPAYMGHPLVKLLGDLSKRRCPEHEDKVLRCLDSQCYSSGRHYWEVEAVGYWDIVVSYQSIKRKGTEGPAFGLNKESWSIKHKGNLFAYHNKMKREIANSLKGNRVVVVVDFGREPSLFLEWV